MVRMTSSPSLPTQGYFPPGQAAPAPSPAQPAQPPAYQPPRGLSPAAALDLAKVVANPIQTVKSLYHCTKDWLVLKTKTQMAIASAGPMLAEYTAARQRLDQAPFKNLLPFFDRALDKWADARFQELRPQVEARISERAWHPVALEWPDGGSGHDRRGHHGPC